MKAQAQTLGYLKTLGVHGVVQGLDELVNDAEPRRSIFWIAAGSTPSKIYFFSVRPESGRRIWPSPSAGRPWRKATRSASSG